MLAESISLHLAHDRESCRHCASLTSLPSASRLDGAEVCPGQAALPQVARASKRDATRGRVLHAFLAAVPEGLKSGLSLKEARAKALAAVPEKFRDDAEVMDLEQLRDILDPNVFAAEVALAYNVDTGVARVLGQGLDRRYDACVREICGTPDVLGLTADAVVVPDYKTGYAGFDLERMRQLLSYALFACRAFNRRRAIAGLIHWRPDGSMWWERAEYSEERLLEFEVELRQIVRGIELARRDLAVGKVPKLVESEHCRRCNAFDFCPAKMSLARQFAAAPDTVEAMLAGASMEQLAQAWLRVDALETVVERVKGALKERAAIEPIQLPDGKIVGALPIEHVNTEVASMVLEAVHGAAVAKAAQKVTVEMSKASIEAALKEHVYEKGRHVFKKLLGTTLDTIRDAGGFKPGRQIRAHWPKKLEE